MIKGAALFGGVSVGSWIFLGIFAVCLAAAGVGAYVIRQKIRSFSRSLFGTDNLAEGLNRQADLIAEMPKSVSSMTKIMEPQIMRDFPDFSWEQFKAKAENMLHSALTAISTENVGTLVADASEEVKNQIVNRIEENRAQGAKEIYRDIQIHQTEISNYKHEKGKRVIVIQSAVGCYHYREVDGKVIEGDRDRKTQSKYNIELVYIQDASAYEYDNAYGTRCPHCGAPIRNIGNMFCEYCGSGVTPINIKVWSLHKFYKVDYNHS